MYKSCHIGKTCSRILQKLIKNDLTASQLKITDTHKGPGTYINPQQNAHYHLLRCKTIKNEHLKIYLKNKCTNS